MERYTLTVKDDGSMIIGRLGSEPSKDMPESSRQKIKNGELPEPHDAICDFIAERIGSRAADRALDKALTMGHLMGEDSYNRAIALILAACGISERELKDHLNEKYGSNI